MYVDVILPLPLRQLLSYRVPPGMEGSVRAGCRVAVELGPRRVYAALVTECHDGDGSDELRPIASVIDSYHGRPADCKQLLYFRDTGSLRILQEQF